MSFPRHVSLFPHEFRGVDVGLQALVTHVLLHLCHVTSAGVSDGGVTNTEKRGGVSRRDHTHVLVSL